jgi:hypothetical protein
MTNHELLQDCLHHRRFERQRIRRIASAPN